MKKIEQPNINWNTDKIVSYTQFSMYSTCPKSWELAYARNLRTKEPSIHLLFGTSIHITIQEWLEAHYKGAEYPYIEKFQTHYKTEFQTTVEKLGKTFSDPDELMAFYQDGVEILTYIDQHMNEYFDATKYEYIGYEIPIFTSIHDRIPNVKLLAYLDLVFRNKRTGGYEIRDIKSSTRGWGDYQINDKSKLAQALLYKFYFSQVYGVDIDLIIVDFVILKRKLDQWDSDRVQIFVPPQFEDDCVQVAMEFNHFVTSVFNNDGSYNLDREYEAWSGRNGSNCRFCEFADKEDLCPIKRRLLS